YDNPDGLGDEVSEYVDYEPWRESPYIAGEESSGGCSTGGLDPALIFLIVPMLVLFSRKKR
ncbi:MAG TPA: SYNERG-CTERM sorting domain-containing protein, partial [Synergistales bacterium]|nr:SYNERG-CTERM sorting domain-containing protein [Synergistales bacterium]